MTTNPQHHFLAGILKTNDGRQLFIDGRTGALELSEDNGSLISINEEGILGVGTALLDLPFFLHNDLLSVIGPEDESEDSFILTCHVDERSGITFYKGDVPYVFTESIKDNQLKFLPFDEGATAVEIRLEEKEIPYDLISGHEHCCSIKFPKPHFSAQWNDTGHHDLVDLAISHIKCNHTDRLSELWDKGGFKEAIYKGLKDADYLPVYNNTGSFKSHFFDPATKENYKGETDPTALTEGLKYYHLSLASAVVEKAGYNLGLALHYFTDLTQPCHAANFTEAYGQEYLNPKKWPLTRVHTFLEKVGDELIRSQPPVINHPVSLPYDNTIEQLYIDTAVMAKSIFGQMLASAPDLAKWYTVYDDMYYIFHPDETTERKEKLRIFLLPYVKDALQKGLEQTIKFLDKWNTDYLQEKPGTYYLNMWTADPGKPLNNRETWLGYCSYYNGYASFLDAKHSENSKILMIQFVDLNGNVVNPKFYTEPVYMIALNYPAGKHVLQGMKANGVYCFWKPMTQPSDGYPLQIYPSTIVPGKFGVRRLKDDGSDNGNFHKSGSYYIEYNQGANDSSIVMDFTVVTGA